jgi:hypothetical protein
MEPPDRRDANTLVQDQVEVAIVRVEASIVRKHPGPARFIHLMPAAFADTVPRRIIERARLPILLAVAIATPSSTPLFIIAFAT